MSSPLSSAPIPPQAGASEVSRSEMQARLAGLGGIASQKLNPQQKEAKLREACEGFESIFVQKMWEEMRKTLPKTTLMHGKEEEFWQGMYNQELAKSMTAAGGIGLADMMYRQLSQSLSNASKATADASSRPPAFAPDAAPLLAERAETPQPESAPAPAAAQAPSAPAVPPQAAPLRNAAAVYDGPAPQDAVPSEPAGQTAQAPAHAAMPTAPVGAPRAEASRPAARERRQAANSPRRSAERSGLDAARMVRFEAGSKLGPGAVRPSLRQIAGLGPATGKTAPANQPAPSPAQAAVPPLTAQGMAAPAAAPAAAGATPAQNAGQAQITRVRHITNIPQDRPQGAPDAIRTLNTGGPDAASARRMAQAAAAERAAALLDGLPPVETPAPPAPPLAAHSADRMRVQGQGGPAPAATGIPPLKAADRRSRS